MFEGFKLERIDTGEATIRVRHGGSGPPLLLLHGHPQTHVMWHLVAPRLAREFTVVAMDLRGYGESSKPKTTEDHEPYSKRAMGRDCLAVMERLGFTRFDLAGHAVIHTAPNVRKVAKDAAHPSGYAPLCHKAAWSAWKRRMKR